MKEVSLRNVSIFIRFFMILSEKNLSAFRFRPYAPRMSRSTKTVKLEVQNVGMDMIRDAVERKGGNNHDKKGKKIVAMVRYQGSRQMGKVLPGDDT